MKTFDRCGQALLRRGAHIATAESCTGGLLAGRVTAMAGSSAVFDTGVITYSNEVKTQLLRVSPSLLATHGAVSAETAKAMATGLHELSRAEYCLTTTGVAGPDSSEGKPVGLVYLGLYHCGQTSSRCLQLRGDRASIREQACDEAVAWLETLLLNKEEE